MTREKIQEQVIKERLAGVDEEVERRYAKIVGQEQLNGCEFLNNNLDEVLAAMNKKDGAFVSSCRSLPPFRFTSQQMLVDGSGYSFKVGNAMFSHVSVYRSCIDAEGLNHYSCGPYYLIVEG